MKIGASRYTSVEAISRFAALLDGRGATRAMVKAPASTRRPESVAAAEQLQAAGFM
jgi:hypothetical protein